ncbi:Hypothetical protein RMHFA_05768 [Roseomonas mucosa]|uniref:hypothetical protein n=1 Tax=Roseomonas TaxID=125216 RepID=UPI000C19A997|nr:MULTISPECIES: hypothetical protein [Roseomonas]HWL81636.1 hypothetical protein [Roseomonas sp.]ATR20212.1 hypothetical protein CTJ15_07810 [Roseomonas sp. FDAARGOS_362]MDT8291233.1 hypothetical protein [Roseomonas mucosa]MDT8349311.1 hypothetical protein [Roseomonas mucosa]UZO97581.1 Hypothetical protein RMHFA_05768 [Roseomonas mucosa]
MTTADRISNDLHFSIGTGMAVFGAALHQGIEQARVRAVQRAAEDARGAAMVHSAVGQVHAQVASDLRGRLIGAEAEIDRLRELTDTLRAEVKHLAAERDEAAAIAYGLLDELESLRGTKAH